ncbi:hypothetical protein F5X99DRAFT_78898 [Biscogniauxia marginata]|nr:hypothetical protein F5X99DRAFT_78898 [Biscogniauxia marginata]
MSQEERNRPGRDRQSSSSEDGGSSSQHATGAPTAPASLLGSAPSLSSGQGPRRPVTRRLTQGIQAYQQSRLGVMSSRDEILRWDDGQINRFKGLTPPPLPSAMLPTKKRTIGEILNDEKPPEKDKLAQEIDKLAQGADPAKGYVLQSGPADPGAGGEASGTNKQKRIRLDPTPRVMPTDETTDMSGNQESPGEGQSSEHTRDTDSNNDSYSVSR